MSSDAETIRPIARTCGGPILLELLILGRGPGDPERDGSLEGDRMLAR